MGVCDSNREENLNVQPKENSTPVGGIQPNFTPIDSNQNIEQIKSLLNENNLLKQKITQMEMINQQNMNQINSLFYENFQMKLYINNLQMMLLNQIQNQQNNNFNNQSFLNMYFAQQYQNNMNWENGQIKNNNIIFRFENEYITVANVSPKDRLRNIFNIMCNKIQKEENKKYCDMNKICFIHNCLDITNHFLNNDEVGMVNFIFNPEIFILKKGQLMGGFINLYKA